MALPNLSITTTSAADAALIALGPLGVATGALCLLSGRLSWSIFFLTLAAFLPFLTSIINLTIVSMVSPTLVILPEGPQLVYRVAPGSTGESLRVAAEALLGIAIGLRYAFLHAHLAARPRVLGPSLKLPAPISSRDVSPSASGSWQARPAKQRSQWLSQIVSGFVTAAVVTVAVLECTWRLAYLIAEGDRSTFHAIYLISFILQTTLLAFFFARSVQIIFSTPFKAMRIPLVRELSPVLIGMAFALAGCIGGIVQAGFTEMTFGRLLHGLEMYSFLLGILIVTFAVENFGSVKVHAKRPTASKKTRHASSFVGLHTPRTSTFHLSPPAISSPDLAAPGSAARPESTTRPPSTYLLTRGPSIRRTTSLRDIRSWLGPQRSSINLDNEKDRLWVSTEVETSTGGPATSATSFGNGGTEVAWPSPRGRSEQVNDTTMTIVGSANSYSDDQPLYRAGPGQQVDIMVRVPLPPFARPESELSQYSSYDISQDQRGTLNTDKRFSVARLLMERRGSQRMRDLSHRISSKTPSRGSGDGSSTHAARNSTTPSDASVPPVSDFPFPQPPARIVQAAAANTLRELSSQQMPRQASMSDDDLFSFKPVMPASRMNSKSDSAMSSFDVTSFIEAGGNRSSADTRRETLLDSLIGPSHLRQLIHAVELDDISSVSSSVTFDMVPPRRMQDDDDGSSMLDTPTVMEVEKATLERATIRRSSSNTRPVESPLEPIPRATSYTSASSKAPTLNSSCLDVLAPPVSRLASSQTSSPQAPSPSEVSSTRTSMTFGRAPALPKSRPPPLTLVIGRQPSRL